MDPLVPPTANPSPQVAPTAPDRRQAWARPRVSDLGSLRHLVRSVTSSDVGDGGPNRMPKNV